MFSDLRYVVRSLIRTKGFTAVTVLTLALGIGSAAAIFSVVDWVLFRSVDFPEDLVILGSRSKEGEFQPAVIEAQRQAYGGLDGVFAETAVAARQTANVVLDGEPVDSVTFAVSANLLPMIGATPVLGRGFLPGEDAEGHNDVVVITDWFWRRYFQGDRQALGRKLIVGETVCTVVGVLGSGQVLPLYFQVGVFRPLAIRPNPANPMDPWYMFFARLAPGVGPTQAEQALAAVKVDLPVQVSAYFKERRPSVGTMRETQKFMRPEIYWLLLGAVGFLYAIACLNATNLMLVRMLGRRRELSIRLALGGGRWRLIRLCVLESAVLSALASAAAVLVANWLVPLLMALAQSRNNFIWGRWTLDWRALAVLGAMTIFTSLAIVIVPALRIARTDVQEGLKEGGAALGESRPLARLRGTFVVLQAAFAVILLTGAGLMVRTFTRLQEVPLGFEPSHRMKAMLMFPRGHVPGPEERLALLKRLQERLAHVPGVLAASYGTNTLLPGYYYAPVTVLLADGSPIKAKFDHVSANFLETSGMKLKRGRMVAERGGEIMVNEAFARARWGDQDPIGQLLKKPADAGSGASEYLVVGLVADVREQLRNAPGYHIYAPETWWPPNMDTFVFRVSREPDALLAAAIKRATYELDPKIITLYVAGLDELRGSQSGLERFVASVLKVLSGIALTLTVVGMFSVLAYTVDRRMGEFGVRLALGATSRDLAKLIMRRGVVLACGGVVIGVAGALALTRTLQSLLFETAPHDPVVLVGVSVLLIAAAALACALPARRATKADVAQLLRRE